MSGVALVIKLRAQPMCYFFFYLFGDQYTFQYSFWLNSDCTKYNMSHSPCLIRIDQHILLYMAKFSYSMP